MKSIFYPYSKHNPLFLQENLDLPPSMSFQKFQIPTNKGGHTMKSRYMYKNNISK